MKRQLYIFSGLVLLTCCLLVFAYFRASRNTSNAFVSTHEPLRLEADTPQPARSEGSDNGIPKRESKPVVPAEELNQINKTLAQTRELCEKVEQQNAHVLQHLRTKKGDETVVVSIREPSEKDYEKYATLLSAMLDGHDGTTAGKDALRAGATELLDEFTDYPMPFKILNLSMSEDGRFASFSERFIDSETRAKVDVENSTFKGASGDRFRSDDWNAKDSWARRRYQFIFEVK